MWDHMATSSPCGFLLPSSLLLECKFFKGTCMGGGMGFQDLGGNFNYKRRLTPPSFAHNSISLLNLPLSLYQFQLKTGGKPTTATTRPPNAITRKNPPPPWVAAEIDPQESLHLPCIEPHRFKQETGGRRPPEQLPSTSVAITITASNHRLHLLKLNKS